MSRSRRHRAMRARRIPVALLLLALLLLAALPLTAAPAAQTGDGTATDDQDAESDPSLLVTELTGTVRPSGTLAVGGEVRNPGGDALEGLRLEGTLLRPSSNRLDLQQAIDEPERAPPRRVVGTFGTDLDPVGGGSSARVRLAAPITETGLGSLPDALAGVYPLRLELRRGSEVLDRVVTAVVALPEQTGQPLRTALVTPLDSALGLSADGSVAGDPLAGGLAEDGPLPALADALERVPGIPVTVATSGVVLSAAEDATDGYTATDAAGAVVVTEEEPETRRAAALIDDVRQVVARSEVEHVALPFASADLVALVRAGQPDAARQAVAQGAVSSAAATGQRPAPGILLSPDYLDQQTLGVLAASADAVLLAAGNVESEVLQAAGLTPTPVRRLPATGNANLTALVADPWLSALLANRSPLEDPPREPSPVVEDSWAGIPPPLAAQRILAETAAVYFERPFHSEARGLLLVPPMLWNFPGEALTALLEGMQDAPWLEPVTAVDLAEQLMPAEDPVALTYPVGVEARELDADYLTAVEEGREAITALATILAADEEPEDADRLLRIATSVYYRGERREQGLKLVNAVQTAASRVFDHVEVVPGPQFTLTSRSGDVPVTLANNSGVAIRVLVRVESPRFAFAEDTREITLAPGEQVPVVFTTEALTPGATAPIQVTVSDIQETRVLDTGRVVVATRADSLTALILTIGAGLFLAGWWLRDVRRRRRGRVEAETAA